MNSLAATQMHASDQPTAKDYVELGLSPIKLYGINDDGSCQCRKPDCKPRNRGKHPTGYGWQNAQINARAVDEHIRRGGNVGLRMGEQSDGTRLIALDEDEPGALASGEEMWGSLPETLTSRTGSGGRHCIYQWPSDREFPRNKVKASGLKFDVRSADGQIVAAPSRNSNGAYSWLNLAPPVMLPEAWCDALSADTLRAKALAPIETPSGAVDQKRVEAVAEIVAEHFELGQRREMARAIGGWLAGKDDVHRWTNPEIAAVVELLPSDDTPGRTRDAIEAAEQRRRGEKITIGWDRLSSYVGDDAARLDDAAMSDAERTLRKPMRGPKARAREAATAEDPGGHEFSPPKDEDGQDVPLILRSRATATTMLVWEGDEQGYCECAKENLRLRISELGYDQSFVSLRDDKNRPRTIEALIEDYGATYKRTAYAFANSATTYDPDHGGRVEIGFAVPKIEPREDREVDAWLRALAGAAYDRLAVWIASCAQSAINRLAAALILVGQADSGKSLLGNAVARLWGPDRAPTRASLLVDRFNGDLLRCPILVDEEAQLFGSRELSTKKFRDEIQALRRSVELKGKERVELIGALRLIVPCNALSDLRFRDVTGPSIVDAVSDRLLLVDATDRAADCRAALALLRPEGGYEVDLARVASHMAWICASTKLPAERFLGCGSRDVAAGAILASHVSETAELWESLRQWLEQPDTDRGPWFMRPGGELAVDAKQLAETLAFGDRRWDLARVNAAISPFVAQAVFHIRPKGRPRTRTSRLDAARLGDAMPDIAVALERRIEGAPPPGGRFGPLNE